MLAKNPVLMLVVVVVWYTSPAFADLSWSSREALVPAELGAESVSGVFGFENDGESAVAIGAVTTSCGCTAAALERRVFAPGEVGEITLTLRVGDRRGPQVKTAKVPVFVLPAGLDAAHEAAVAEVTAGTPTRLVTLTLKTKIPRAYTLSPRLLLWHEPARNPRGVDQSERGQASVEAGGVSDQPDEPGGGVVTEPGAAEPAADAEGPAECEADADPQALLPEEKTAVLRAGDGVSFAVTGVASSDPRFAVRVQTLRERAVHRIVVRPLLRDALPTDAWEDADAAAALGAVPSGDGKAVEAWDTAVITVTTDLPQEKLRTVELVVRARR